MENFVRITEPNVFGQLVERSHRQPIVIFKHSTTCPISAGAYREMEQFPGEVALIEVQNARELSREVEVKTGITHESPQVIVLRKGQVVFDASHWDVKAKAVADAVGAHS